MASEASVTTWIDQLKSGDHGAAQKLWERYFGQLVQLARARLQGLPRPGRDEEDVALSAFDSFWRGARAGRFPRLDDRSDLWQLLVMLTARKAVDLVREECRQKRGGGMVQQISALPPEDQAQLLGREPTPQFAAQVADECRHLLESLQDPQLRAVALWKMEGCDNQEIATLLGRSLPTVERKLQRIRDLWREEMEKIS